MSTFLIATMPAAGHVQPAVPLAHALLAAGHRVVWHTGTEYAGTVERTGATFVPAKRTPSFTDIPVEPDPGSRGAAAAVSVLRRFLVDRMAGQVADYEEILARHHVDAIVVDLCALGGRAVHERHGIPWATLGIGPLTIVSPDTPQFGTGAPPPRGRLGRTRNRLTNLAGGIFLRGVTTAYRRQRAVLGLPPLPPGVTVFDHMTSQQRHLQAATPLIEYPRHPWPANVTFVGPLLPPAPTDPADLPGWWGELAGDGPVVHVTQGTVATDPAILTRPAIDGLADLDGLVVVTTPDPAGLGRLPGNVRVARYLPHALLLPHVDVMVTNGGYNGTKAALAHGIPSVFAPWGNDQPDVAARVSWAGAGINLRTRTPRPAAVAAAVRAALDDPAYRRAAGAVRTEFHRYGLGGERAAEALVALVEPVVAGQGGAGGAAGR